MKKFTNNDTKFINENFGSEQIFRSYCKDRLQFDQIDFNEELHIEDDFDYFTSGEEGVTTGIIIDAYYDDELDQLVLCLLVEGKIRVTFADESTVDNIYRIALELKENPKNYTLEEIDRLAFVHYKPFLLSIDDDITTLIRPLSFDIYDKALALYEKVSAA